jgi:diguanylate cyclase (GGDEF)-like protein
MNMPATVEPSRSGRGPAVGVWILNLVLASASGTLLYLNRGWSPPAPGGGLWVWLFVLAGFTAAEVWVVHLQFRREAHTVALGEIPVTVGLFFLAPWQVFIALLLGVGPALVFHRRQSLVKVIFNLAELTLGLGTATLVFHLAVGTQYLSPRAWVVAILATAAASLIGIASIRAVISVTEGRLALNKTLPVTAFGLAGSVVNTCFALVVVVIVVREPGAAVLLLLPGAALVLAYQAYTRERQKTERIEFLYNSGRTLAGSGSGDGEPGIIQLLREALAMFRAEVAQVAIRAGDEQTIRTTVRGGAVEVHEQLVPTSRADYFLEHVMSSPHGVVVTTAGQSAEADEYLREHGLRDAMVTALQADNRVVGTILIGNRVGDINEFNQEQLNLLETLATQVGVSVENSRLERVLQHQAFHDALTNLANRALLNQRMEATLANRGAQAAVLVIDVDDFKTINDTMGHGVGDQLLVAATERISGAVRTGDLAARIGGDEFAVLVESIGSVSDATATAQRIIEAFKVPFALVGQQVRVTASIGIATNLDGVLDPGTLMLQADVAMYASKASGRGGYMVFESSMQDAVAERHALREDLRLALERGELLNHYQPLVSLERPAILGAEALVRWRHPERGLVAPGFFIQLAEESGLIVDLGRWVLREACAQLREWQRTIPGAARMGMSVNLSAVQLREPGFVDDVVAILKDTGIEPGTLTLEITESTFMDDTRTAIARLRELRGLGIRLELDDFGTGYSSLSILRDLPLDGLKIDKSFVDVIHGASDRPAFLQAIVRLAEALDLEMVGEGIEEQHQADALRAMGCGRGQGYFYSKPLPSEQMAAYLEKAADWVATADAGVVAMPRRRTSD